MKIILVDDHPIVRKGMKTVLEDEGGFEVCAEAEDGNSALKLITEHEPDLVIVDIELKGNVNGIELVKAISQRFPLVKTLIMSIDDGTLYAERSIRAGAKGYIAKEEASENILIAIDTILKGKLYLSNVVANKIASKHIYGTGDSSTPDIDILSNRELEIFKLIGRGYKRSEISRNLSMNINTIESHRRNIREKLNINSSSELSKVAVHWHSNHKK